MKARIWLDERRDHHSQNHKKELKDQSPVLCQMIQTWRILPTPCVVSQDRDLKWIGDYSNKNKGYEDNVGY
jgi:hypothetical protein